ncbi:MAG: prephenate dehydrogenase/arogenate dehydrogenase family protein, partial [Ignavibacteriales bacterium]|nr:prephenate dehydrogenase/arogenate dehydrogenase family protein [Ignavibacteriales bacterium]
MNKSLKRTANDFQQVTIIGVGLIGGSLGLAIKQRFRSCRVIGVDKPDVLDKAIARGAIDEGKLFIAEAVRDADLIFIATPISSILTLLPLVGRYSRPQSIVTDVGSVKGPITQKASQYFPKGNFIGGHPMAGVELSGVEAAHPLLFENAMYVLTPSKKTPPKPLKRLSNFLTKLGARVVQLDAKVHDEVAS